MALKFKDLRGEEFIYRVNPFTGIVEGIRVQQVIGVYGELIRGKHPTAAMYKHWVRITCYMRERLVHAIEIEKTPTFDLILDGQAELQLGMTRIEGHEILFPIPYSPNKKLLEEYVKSSR